MFRYKSNKRAFIVAALIILLCLVCLAGTTLAIFTSGDSGKISIVATSGNFEVDIIDATTGDSLVDQMLQLQTTSNNREILFEPGATFFTQGFKIKNDGDIPINFIISLSDSEDTERFLESFEVWVSTSPTNNPNAERESKFPGSLEADSISDDTYYLFVKMKETAGNEVQNQEYTVLGVTVYAVQGNVEIEE